MSCPHRTRLAIARLASFCLALVCPFAAATLQGARAQEAPQAASPKQEAPKAAARKKNAGKQEPVKLDPLDWPAWRGPQQNSTSTEKGLVDKWNPKDPWKRNDLGTRSTPIVMRGKLYALVRDKPGTENEGEKVVCVDAATGEEIWQYRFNVYLTDTPDTRVAWSSVAGDPETGRVYAQGVCGYFCCLEGDSGKLVWDHDLHEEVGVITTYGGRTNVPVVFEDTVLISAVVVGWGDTPEFDLLARPSHRFMAFDKATGELRWLAGTSISPPDTTYSTPVVTAINGEKQLIFGGADGQVWGLQPRTGKPLWNFPFSRHGLNGSPLVVGDTVYMAQGLENMVGTTKGGVVAIDAKQRGNLAGKEKWLAYNISASKSSPIMVEGRVWVIDDGSKLFILDPATGKTIAKKALGTRQGSTPLYADGKVYACTASGIWYVLKPTEKGVDVLQKMRLAGGDENDGSPIVSHGRIYLPTSNALYSISVKNVQPSADPLPEPPQEASLGDDPNPALVQVSPFDVTLKPGDKQKFSVRLYNSRGQLVRVAKPDETEFRVVGPGEVKGEGEYTAAAHDGHVGALVVCKVGALEGKARVRIVPPLPWQFDFNKGEIPITWIGGRVRYKLRDVDGERCAVKLDVLPTPANPANKLGTRSAMYMGPASLANYTIQGDFRLTEKNGRLPEVTGLINSGYTLSIRPENAGRQLSLYSWASHDYRTQTSAPLEARPDVWYRMKLMVEQGKGKADAKGKIWLRDQPEPKEWTVQMVDQTPVKSGSPGIFGNTQMAEFMVDNLSVVPNE
jgi:outer membrane protein assembly factor BamB